MKSYSDEFVTSAQLIKAKTDAAVALSAASDTISKRHKTHLGLIIFNIVLTVVLFAVAYFHH